MIKKLVIKVLIMVGVMVGISNYAVYLMTGRSPISKEDIALPTISTPKLPVGKDTAYKWVDEKGRVHYSTEPPQIQGKIQKMEVDPNQNLIKGVETQTASPEASTQTPDVNMTSPYTPDGAQKLIEDAKNVQHILDERYERQKQIIDAH